MDVACGGADAVGGAIEFQVADLERGGDQIAIGPAVRFDETRGDHGESGLTQPLSPAMVSSDGPGAGIAQGKRIPQERLVAEALNLLFAKYNLPVVRDRAIASG